MIGHCVPILQKDRVTIGTTSSCSNYKISSLKLFYSHLNKKIKEKHAK